MYANVYSIDSTEESSIEFLQLEATVASKVIHFKWEVQREQKGDYFIIEKSIDESTWKEVSRTKSIGNHLEIHTYLTSEINLAEGAMEFFRILRFDGYGNYSELDRIRIHQPILTALLLIPVRQKTKKEVILSYNSKIASSGTLIMKDKGGNIVIKKSMKLAEGYNRYVMNVKKINDGEYTVTLTDQKGNSLQKILVVGAKSSRRTKF
jgi:hypothetical protein